jgi:acetoin utilization deacetylase AcuC-like enzyme
MSRFGIYFHQETCQTSIPRREIEFVGHSLPYFDAVREQLASTLRQYYPEIPLRKAAYDQFLTVHDPSYLDAIRRMSTDNQPQEIPKMSMECIGYEYCLPGYLYSLGGLLEAVDLINEGKLERAYCFSLGGHHAYADWGHGYCLLNPQAAAIRYAQERGFNNILVVDWDLQHGDGTQSIFAHDSSVYCISIHSVMDLYMAFMTVLESGTTTTAHAVGHCNIPVLQDLFDDEFFQKMMSLDGAYYRAEDTLSVFRQSLEDLPFSPDMIFIFSGYDAHIDDCGDGVTDWTYDDFQFLTEMVLDVAVDALCPVISSHGGGYNLDVTVKAAYRHIETLATYW